MRVLPTRLDGLVAIEPAAFGDERGFFCETYRSQWHEQLGIGGDARFVQDNHSRSSRGVLRGMHFQLGAGVAKLVRCSRGRIFDVAVVIYKQTAYYDPELERGIAFNDPDVGIQWPLPEDELIVSERDAAAPQLRDLKDELPFVYA